MQHCESLGFTQQAGDAAVFASLDVLSQQAFGSSQQLSPSAQHVGADWQQPLSSAQHFRPWSQQSGFSALLQHFESSLQQASF